MINARRCPRTLGVALTVVLVFAACEGSSFSYSNPLDPKVDAPVSDVVGQVEDPDLRRAIIDSAEDGSATSKNEIRWVNAPSWDGYNVNSLQGLEFFPNVDGLNLDGASGLSAADYAVLGRLSRLQGFVLWGAGLDDEDLRLIGSNVTQGINWINVGGNNITIVGVQSLVRGTRVETLQISGPDNDNDPGYEVTSGGTVFNEFASAGIASQLRHIELAHFGLTGADLAGLSVFPQLRGIDLRHNRIESVDALNAYLSGGTGVDGAIYVNLAANPLTEQELAELDLTNVRHLDIWSMVGPQGPGSALTDIPLFENPGNRLENLYMGGNDSITSLANLGDLLSEVPLENISLGNSSITGVDEFLVRRGDGTFAAQNLRRIYLDNINGAGSPLQSVEELVQLPTLEELYLYDSTVADLQTVRRTFDARPDIYVEYPDGSTNQPPPPPPEENES